MLFIETPIFTKLASGGLFAYEELKELQKELIESKRPSHIPQMDSGL